MRASGPRKMRKGSGPGGAVASDAIDGELQPSRGAPAPAIGEDEYGRAFDEIAAPQAARVRDQPVGPFEPQPPSQSWCASGVPRDELDRSADAKGHPVTPADARGLSRDQLLLR